MGSGRAGRGSGRGVGDGGGLEGLEQRVMMSALTFAELADRFNIPTNLHDIERPGAEYEGFGHAATALGDIDGDGFGDFAISAPGSLFGAETPVDGAVFVYSGQSGSLVRMLSDGTSGFGFSLANIGDINNDGVNDLLIGSPQYDSTDDGTADQFGRAWIYSGADGAELRFHDGAGIADELGFAVAIIGDLNDDGVNEYAVGAPGAGGAGEGQLTVFSGSDGAVIYTFTGAAAGHRFGAAVIGADVGPDDGGVGDGIADILIGAPGSEGAPDFAGGVYLYDGAAGTLRWSLEGENAGDGFGTALGVSHIPGEANTVIYVGTPGFDAGLEGEIEDAGQVFRVNQDGTLHDDQLSMDGAIAGGRFGQSITVVGDVNGDGFDDYAVTTPGAEAGQRVRIFSGAEAAATQLELPQAAIDAMGDFVFALGDVDNDGFADLGAGLASGERFGALSSLLLFPPTIIGITSDNLDYIITSGEANGRSFAIVNGELVSLARVPGLLLTDQVVGVNNSGDMVVVSNAAGEEGIFIIRGGTRTRLQDLLHGVPTDPAPNYATFVAVGIGNGGDVLFTDTDNSTDEGEVQRSWLLRGEALTFLWEGSVLDVNASGQILGVQRDGAIVLRAADGASTQTIDLAQAWRVNDEGMVVGLNDDGNLAAWQDGAVTELAVLETPEGWTDVVRTVVDLNNDGSIVLHLVGVSPESLPNTMSVRNYLFVPGEGLSLLSDITFDVDAGENLAAPALRLAEDGTVVSSNGFYTPVADDAPWIGLDGAPLWASATGDSLVFAGINQYGDAVLMTHDGEGWHGWRINIAGLETFTTFTINDVIVHTDAETGWTYAFLVSDQGGFVAVTTFDETGAIVAQALNGGEGSTQIVSRATVFTSGDGRVHIAGVNADGDLIIYYQDNREDVTRFVYDNLTDVHIEGQEITFNAIESNLTVLVTDWGASHLFYLGEQGELYSVWIGLDMTYWVYTNISQNLHVGSIDDNPDLALHGDISAYSTAWGGLNVVGAGINGDPTAIWWVPGFEGTWHIDKLHGFDDQPEVAFNPASVTSYTAPWESLHVASIQESGEISVYWWGPNAPRWDGEILNIDERPEGLTFTGAITSATMGETLNLFARGNDGDLYRMFWNPGDGSIWSLENMTEALA